MIRTTNRPRYCLSTFKMWRYSTSRSASSRHGERRLRRATHLVLDWDSTLTVKDTMDQLGKLPHERDARIKREKGQAVEHHDQNVNPAPNESSKDWGYFFKAYLDDYVPHKEKYHPESGGPRELCKYLATLKSLEQRSVQRVGDSGFFRGVKECDVFEVGKAAIQNGDVELRRYWVELFEMFVGKEDGSQITILSVNWSATFIRSCLFTAASRLEIDTDRRKALVDYIENMNVIANDFEGLKTPEGSTGRVIGGIQTSTDKLSKMPLSKRSKFDLATADWRIDRDPEPYVFYIGDSPTDYECILAADFGFWLEPFTNDHQLPNFNKTFGQSEIAAVVLENGTWETEGRNWWMIANNFEEVVCFLDQLNRSRMDKCWLEDQT